MSYEWKSTSYSLRCPWCGDAGRCSVRADFGACCCRTADANEGAPRLDKTGQPFWYHALEGGDSRAVVARQSGPPAADLDTRHRAYLLLLAKCGLQERHRSNLRQRFGVNADTSGADLAKLDRHLDKIGYRSAPMHDRATIAGAIVAELGEAVVRTLPGLYQKDGEWTLSCAPGILIPVRTAEGLITALKVRRDEAGEDGSRYFYMSSKRHGGPGPQLACHVPLGVNDIREIRVTEGELKADVATFLSGVLTISIPGVASWHHARPAIAELSKSVNQSMRTVTLAFDADAARKPQVARPLKCLLEEVMDGAGRYQVIVERWPEVQADGRETKGIDDLLALGLAAERLDGAAALAWVEEVLQAGKGSDESGMFMDLLDGIRREKNAALLEREEVIRLLVDLPALEMMRVERELAEALGRKFRIKALHRAMYEHRSLRSSRERSARLDSDGLPVIETYNRHVRRIADDGVAALLRQNEPPRLFRFGRKLARIETDAQGRLVVEELNDLSLCSELEAVASWTRITDKGRLLVPAPREVVRELLGRAGTWQEFPPLLGAVSTPVYTHDRQLITTPGYHASSGLYFEPADGSVVQPVGPSPNAEAIAWARRVIVAEVLGEFPFADEASRAHAVALMLLPFVRQMIEGQTPLFAIDAPTPGSGKGLLFDACSRPFVPQGVPAHRAPCKEEEWDKLLLTALRQGPSHIFIDNVDRLLSSAALASALTEPTYDGRILGKSENASCPVRCVWAVTGNNLLTSKEIARRMVRIRIDARMESPTARTFRHEDLRRYVGDQRMTIIQAVLTLIQAWIAADCPSGAARLASYTAWSEVMSGILDVAGIPGFLGNAGAYDTDGAPEQDEWRAFVSDWWAMFADRPVASRELLTLAESLEHLASGIGNTKSDVGKSFGLALRRQTDCVYHGKRITKTGIRRGAPYYHLEIIDAEAHAQDLAERALDNPS